MPKLSKPTLRANTHNWNPGLPDSSVFSVTLDGDRQISGLIFPPEEGDQIKVHNNSPFGLGFLHENAGSQEANRFTFGNAATYTLPAGHLVSLIYLGRRWRLASAAHWLGLVASVTAPAQPAPAPTPTPAPTQPAPTTPTAAPDNSGKPAKAPLYPNSVGCAEVAHLQLLRWEVDKSYLTSVDYLDMKQVEWVDNDDTTGMMQMAHIYRANFSNSTPILIQIDKDIPDHKLWGDRFAQRLGIQPKIHRDNMFHINLVDGNKVGATAESAGHFFMMGLDRAILRFGEARLEETFFHEGTHASIQQEGSGRGYNYLTSDAWNNAVRRDNAFITTYASTKPQEDFAESSLFAYAIIFHPERFSDEERARVINQIPNRIEFFRTVYAA